MIQCEILDIPDSDLERYDNPFEQKYTLRNKFNFYSLLNLLFDKLQEKTFIDILSKNVGYELFLDNTRNFWGVHKYKTSDKLDIHVDTSLHPSL